MVRAFFGGPVGFGLNGPISIIIPTNGKRLRPLTRWLIWQKLKRRRVDEPMAK